MSNGTPASIDNAQWERLLDAVKSLVDHQSYWGHFLTQAAPVFLGSLLGIGSALFLDWLKTRREASKALKDGRKQELAQLNLVSTAMGFNLENLQHIAMQQVLPHFHQSYAANLEVESFKTAEEVMRFGATMSDRFPKMTTRCPELFFFELEFLKEIPFVLEKDPEILKLSGWMTNFMNELRNNLKDRNERIDAAGRESSGFTVPDLLEHVRVQMVIGSAEVVHTYQLMQQVMAICEKLKNVVEKYKDIKGAHLKVIAPEPLAETMAELKQITGCIVPDLPPPEPITES